MQFFLGTLVTLTFTLLLTTVTSYPLNSGKPVVVGYYPDWTASSYPPEAIPYDKLTHINYAFAVVSATGDLSFDTAPLLDRVVSQAHAKGVKVLLSVGGWTGSRYFSPVAKNPTTRQTFIGAVLDVVDKHKLDGIDIDWEFPGRTGLSCNEVDLENDTPNFLLLLNELRKALAPEKEITLATRITPFEINGAPSNVAAFADPVNFINVMAYDINGAWSPTTGSNAPLTGSGALSFAGSAEAWLNAGWPKDKLVMGLPFYGRAVTVVDSYSQGTSPLGLKISAEIPKGDSDDALWADSCPGSKQTFSGIWKWKNLCTSALGPDGKPLAGWQQGWDAQSQTPWLYNPESKAFVSYDDPRSLKLKVDHVKHHGYAGVMIWDLHQDNGDLIQAVHSSL